jgi:LytS/YehU family sensor histidine kinase
MDMMPPIVIGILLLYGFMLTGLVVWLLLRARRHRHEEDRQQHLLRMSRLQVIQGQMNPHFIFNVLGSIQHAILTEKPAEANRLLIRLSRLLRNFLDASVQASSNDTAGSLPEISLRKELELVQDYMAFERMQMNDKFDFVVDVDDELDIDQLHIPPMLLQPLLENAVKHGVSYLEAGGIVALELKEEGEGFIVFIRDNGVGREESKRRQRASLRAYRSHGSELVHEKIRLLNECGYAVSVTELDLAPGMEVQLHFH